MFTRTYCISLARRPDRWAAFTDCLPTDWPFPQPERFEAIDGTLCTPPAWWRLPPGAWGCLLSHLAVLADAIQAGHEAVLICEDDAVFVDGFTPLADQFLRHVPDDWGMIYMGGGSLYHGGQLNQDGGHRVNDHVLAPNAISLTHCYAVHRRAMLTVYRHICGVIEVPGGKHIDNHLQTLHRRHEFPLYAPHYWLAGQRAGRSDIHTERVRAEDNFYNYQCGP